MFYLSQCLVLTRNKLEAEHENAETQAQTQLDANSSGQTVTKDPAVGDAWKHVTDRWQLDEPKMIISVTGGARRFFMKQRLLKSFKRGLMKAATAAGEL